MKAFLTSHLGCHDTLDEVKVPAAMTNPNGLERMLRSALGQSIRLVVVASDPDAYELNDFYARLDADGLKISGIDIRSYTVLDGRNEHMAAALISDCDLLLLSGGHVPTQHRFFEKIELKEKLKSFDGVLIGISAGSMNSCRLVYAQPELTGEAADPNYVRWFEGLGIVKVSLVPHWQEVRQLSLDGLRIFEDISLPDSLVHPFYALVDGSFIYCEGGHAALYGEGYYFDGGKASMVSREGEVFKLY